MILFESILHKKKRNLCRENLSINFSYDLHYQKKVFYLTLPLSSILMSPKSMTVKPFSSSLSIRPACHVMIKQVLSDRSMEVWLPQQQADMRVHKEICFLCKTCTQTPWQTIWPVIWKIINSVINILLPTTLPITFY